MTYLKLLVILVWFLIPTSAFAQTNDVTSSLENLGNPFRARWADGTPCVYARNVWDLQSFGSKLYIGSGNSGNDPCGNAGPINFIAYDPATNTYTTEYTGNTEQIDRFIILNGQLVTPSHDPRGLDELAIFRKGTTSWTKQTGITPAAVVHTYDLMNFGGSLFASVGGVYSSVYISSDGGANWQAGNSSVLDRGYAMFTLNGKLYLIEDFGISSTTPALYEYVSGASFTALPAIQFAQMYPGISTSGMLSGKIQRPTNYLSMIVYIGAATTNDHQGDPFGLFKASTFSSTGTDASKITLPGNAKPWDVLVGSDGKLYVLGSIPNGARYWVTVMSTTDLNTWTEEFRFDSVTYARSLEQLNGDFYFGLGTNTTPLSTVTGDILRYKILAPSPSPSISLKPGDIDGDNDVDIFDYNILLTNFGKTGNIQGDLDSNSAVDIFDYNILLTNFGK